MKRTLLALPFIAMAATAQADQCDNGEDCRPPLTINADVRVEPDGRVTVSAELAELTPEQIAKIDADLRRLFEERPDIF